MFCIFFFFFFFKKQLSKATVSVWNRAQNSVFEHRIARNGSISKQLCFSIGVILGTIIQTQQESVGVFPSGMTSMLIFREKCGVAMDCRILCLLNDALLTIFRTTLLKYLPETSKVQVHGEIKPFYFSVKCSQYGVCISLFVVCLTTLVMAHITQCQMIRWLVNNKLRRNGRQHSLPSLNYSGTHLRRSRKITENPDTNGF